MVDYVHRAAYSFGMNKRRRDLVTALARVGLATLFTGPVGGAREAGGQAIGLLSAEPSRATTSTSILNALRRDVEAFARSEHVDEQVVDQVFETVTLAIERHGATIAECVDLDFSVQRIAGRVLGRAAGLLKGLLTGVSDWCNRLVVVVYERLLADPAALQELDREFQRQVLERLTRLSDLPAATAAAVRQLAAGVVFGDPRRRWRADMFGEASLVRAEFAIVPFYGRNDELDEFDTWCRQGPPVALRLYMGAGGMGKTRLMIEACARIRAAGWRSGFLHRGQESQAIAALSVREPTMIVVDYAETRRRELCALLAWALNRDSGQPARVVALARRQGDWWQDLATESAAIGAFIRGPAATALALRPLANAVSERATVLEAAAAVFASRLGRNVPAQLDSQADLSAEHFELVLLLHLAALALVLGTSLRDDSELLDFALDRERGIWNSAIEAAGLPGMRGPAVQQAAALVTLAGKLDTREDAITLLSRAPALGGQPATAVSAIADLFHTLYPGDGYIEGVQPDLLGEQLLRRQLPETPTLPMVLFGAS
jgi:hypothetical protein